jgi:hypothetical protein
LLAAEVSALSQSPSTPLREAATFITTLPKAEQQAPQWQLAAKMLLFVAERGGDLLNAAQIGAAD